jgi:Zn-dependent peptidase ImmA (M78 family)
MHANELLARRTANELLDECNIKAAPVDVEWIVRQKQLMFEETTQFPEGVYGALFRSGNQFGIAISSTCPGEGHRRFTIAHELGHYHIPGHVEKLLPGNDDRNALSLGGHFRTRKDPVEVEADAFANELLMPDRFVRGVIRMAGSGLAAVRTLATTFCASLTAAGIRYASVTGDPVAIIISYKSVVEWAAISSSLRAHRWGNRTLKKEWAPRGSGTRRLAAAQDRIRRGEVDTDSMLLCEWFEGAEGDIETVEEAVGLGNYGRVMTVLTAVDLGEPEADDGSEENLDDGRTHDWRDAMRGYRLG